MVSDAVALTGDLHRYAMVHALAVRRCDALHVRLVTRAQTGGILHARAVRKRSEQQQDENEACGLKHVTSGRVTSGRIQSTPAMHMCLVFSGNGV